MKRKIMALGAVLAWVCGVFGATHEGVQLWENGPLWAKTNIGAGDMSRCVQVCFHLTRQDAASPWAVAPLRSVQG